MKTTTFATLMLVSLASQAGQPIINLNVGGELAPGVYGQVLEPMYLHVPPRHSKNWRRYCREYEACGRPVFFVRSEEYEPGYRKGRGRGHDRRDHEGDHDRHEDRGDRGDRHDNHGNRGEHRGDKHDH